LVKGDNAVMNLEPSREEFRDTDIEGRESSSVAVVEDDVTLLMTWSGNDVMKRALRTLQ
jgi:hypothetical protein